MSEGRRRAPRNAPVPRGNDLPAEPQPKLRKEDERAPFPELDSSVHMYGQRGEPLVIEAEGMPEDVFEKLYGERLDGEEPEDWLTEFEKAHAIDPWLHLRKRERERIVELAEEAEAELEDLRKSDADQESIDVATEGIRDLDQIARSLVVGTLTKRDSDTAKSIERILKQGDVVVSHALEVEDDRAGVVETVSRNLIIEPPFSPAVLEHLVLQNNTLCQLVNAMEVNVAGTGWEIVPNDTLQMEEDIEDEMGASSDPNDLGPDDEDRRSREVERQRQERQFEEEVNRQLEAIQGLFDEPFPNMSMTTLKRKLWHDLEATGNAYMEVVRNQAGEVMLLRHIDSKMMRLVRLDDPVLVPKQMKRAGQDITLEVSMRERKFVLSTGGGAISPRFRNSPSGSGSGVIEPDASTTELDTRRLFSTQGTRLIYFKEFGASRDLDMWTGVWSAPGEQIPMERRATEIIHLTGKKDARTPYGLPRWINNLPSVLGSRKAEEFNLSFFDQGGVPPLLITVAGGTLAKRTKEALDQRFNTRNPAAKHQAVIMEVASSGRLDKTQRVQVAIERFGSERMQDSMFQKYDERTSQLIRSSFRLPPLFVGQSEEHNFATAKASYLVAEAQVFAPERAEFDEHINLKLLRTMPEGENFSFVSKPLVIDSSDDQLSAIELALTHSLLKPEDAVAALNKVVNLGLRFDQETLDQSRAMDAARVEAIRAGMQQQNGQPPGQEGPPQVGSRRRDEAGGAGQDQETEVQRRDLLKHSEGLASVGLEVAEAMIDGRDSPGRLAKAFSSMAGLLPHELEFVKRVVSMRLLGGDDPGLRELTDCSATIIGHQTGA